MSTLQELMKQQASLERQIAEAKHSARSEALGQVRALMQAHGLTTADLVSQTRSRPATGAAVGIRGKVAPKYRHPVSGETWSGRGLKPKWLTAELNAGRQMAEFAI